MPPSDAPFRLPPAEARSEARRLIDQLCVRAPEILDTGGVSLAGAMEQQLFFALRDGVPPPGAARAALRFTSRVGRTLVGVAASPFGFLTGFPAESIAAILREPIHLEALRLIEAHLSRKVVVVRVGRAASLPAAASHSVQLYRLLHPADGAALARHAARVGSRWDEAAGDWSSPALRDAARDALSRVALGATALNGLARRQPALIAAFDEIGTWARLIGEVGRRHDIPTLDLPHAEAADPIAIVGTTYDRMAVYGPRAAAVLRAAGVPDDRIVEIGAPRFDSLIRAGPAAPARAAPRQVIFAAQYVTGRMTSGALEQTLRAAVAAAGAVAPAGLVVRPHPAEPSGQIAAMVSRMAAPAGVSIRIESQQSLHDLLASAWLVVTGWSNSVFEAAVAGVPSIAVDPQRRAPVRYADEGLALPATDAASAAAAAASLQDPVTRNAAVERAREALERHIGPLDGNAAARAAALIEQMANSGARSGARP